MTDIGQRFDDVLRNLAGQAGSLEALLGVFFSFLHRNTDFYVTFDPAKTTRAGMGFPPGKAEQLLLSAFRSFPYKPYGGDGNGKQQKKQQQQQQQQQRRAVGGGRPTAAAAAAATTSTTAPSSGSLSSKGKASRSVDPVPSGQRAPSPSSSSKNTSAAAAPGPATSTLFASPPSSSTKPSPSGPLIPPTNPNAARAPAPAGDVRVRYTKDGKQVPIGNGGVTPRYYWTQTVHEATVYVDVPPGTRSKDVSCVIQPRRLKLRVRGAGVAAAAAATAGGGVAPADRKGAHKNDDDDGDVIFDGELPSAVSREDSMWSLNDGTTVVLSFEKTTKSWWKSVVEGDPEIDTSQVDSTTKISEYDGETQGAIRKIMFDQRQKSLGLPTSDQLNADAVLERAKLLPGSPFLPGGVLFEDDGAAGAGGGVSVSGDGIAPDGGGRDPPPAPVRPASPAI